MEVNNQIYDVEKWLVLIFLPAFAVLISGLGELYIWSHTAEIVTTINLFTMLVGSILQLSSQKYNGGGGDDSKYTKSC